MTSLHTETFAFFGCSVYICRVILKCGQMNVATKDILIPKMRQYFATQPIAKAWLFGSFSRGEESENSDVDILVDFDKDARIGLFKFAGMYGDLKELLGREVDLVKNGTLKPFAAESANRDKVLIYERSR